MKIFDIFFLSGNDRPGIVDEVSTVLFKHGANIEESHMTVMGGRFCIMALYSCEASKADVLRESLLTMRDEGFDISLHAAQAPEGESPGGSQSLRLEVHAMDHPGIVQKIVHTLHQYDINVNTLNTRIVPAPLSGAPLFDLTLEAVIPPEIPAEQVKADITDLATKMNVDLKFEI